MDQETLEMAGNRNIDLGSKIAYREVKEYALQRYDDLQARTPKSKEALAAVGEESEETPKDDDALFSNTPKGKAKRGQWDTMLQLRRHWPSRQVLYIRPEHDRHPHLPRVRRQRPLRARVRIQGRRRKGLRRQEWQERQERLEGKS